MSIVAPGRGNDRKDPLFSPSVLCARLQRLPTPRRYLVAYSGGADSTALLCALIALRSQLAPLRVAAAHVNHGLAVEADAWERHCERTCRDLGVGLDVVRVQAAAGPGESPEARARAERYAALKRLVEKGDMLLTAHHQDDQAETVLLQLLRGAGPRGLAAMPACRTFGAGWIGRPLLGIPRRALVSYARGAELAWIEDASNADARYDRNFLRREIFPRLNLRWPSAGATLARSAAHQGQAAALSEAIGRQDLEAAGASDPAALSCSALRSLESGRAGNVLRVWMRERGIPVPGARQLDQLLGSVVHARPDRMPLLRWGGVEARRYRDRLYVMACLPDHGVPRPVVWRPPEVLMLPYGRLAAIGTVGGGLDARLCERCTLRVGFRTGGERCRLSERARSRSLKKLFQEHAVPPWLRGRAPLIFADGDLAAVAGMWICAGYGAKRGEPGWEIDWQPLS